MISFETLPLLYIIIMFLEVDVSDLQFQKTTFLALTIHLRAFVLLFSSMELTTRFALKHPLGAPAANQHLMNVGAHSDNWMHAFEYRLRDNWRINSER